MYKDELILIEEFVLNFIGSELREFGGVSLGSIGMNLLDLMKINKIISFEIQKSKI
mgnify:CR=1 FL=1